MQLNNSCLKSRAKRGVTKLRPTRKEISKVTSKGSPQTQADMGVHKYKMPLEKRFQALSGKQTLDTVKDISLCF